MKVFSLCAALLGPSVALAAASTTSLSGAWRQVFSNKYVQSTSEVDWRCIKAYAIENDKLVHLHKLARLHGRPQIVVTPKDTVYDIHEYSNDSLVITGEDNPALFVWTRDGGGDEEAPVDIPRLLAFVDKIGFKNIPFPQVPSNPGL